MDKVNLHICDNVPCRMCLHKYVRMYITSYIVLIGTFLLIYYYQKVRMISYQKSLILMQFMGVKWPGNRLND